MRIVAILCLVSGLGLAAPAEAENLWDAKVVLHVKARTNRQATVCTSWSPVNPDTATWHTTPPIPCSRYATKAEVLRNYDVYLVVGQADQGIAGLSCGLSYKGGDSGLAIYQWTRCSDAEFPTGGWPASGGGNRILWSAETNCQKLVVPPNGIHAVAGSFYVYAYGEDRLRVTANQPEGQSEVRILSCVGEETSILPEFAGWIQLSAIGWSGFNPCQFVPVSPSTWGRLKNAYGR